MKDLQVFHHVKMHLWHFNAQDNDLFESLKSTNEMRGNTNNKEEIQMCSRH